MLKTRKVIIEGNKAREICFISEKIRNKRELPKEYLEGNPKYYFEWYYEDSIKSIKVFGKHTRHFLRDGDIIPEKLFQDILQNICLAKKRLNNLEKWEGTERYIL